jgi:beta-glucosidase
MSSAFPKNFFWGTATAAHQVEGNNIHSDWWEWEKLPGKVKKNEHSGIACDHWGRFEQDLALMRELGVNA